MQLRSEGQEWEGANQVDQSTNLGGLGLVGNVFSTRAPPETWYSTSRYSTGFLKGGGKNAAFSLYPSLAKETYVQFLQTPPGQAMEKNGGEEDSTRCQLFDPQKRGVEALVYSLADMEDKSPGDALMRRPATSVARLLPDTEDGRAYFLTFVASLTHTDFQGGRDLARYVVAWMTGEESFLFPKRTSPHILTPCQLESLIWALQAGMERGQGKEKNENILDLLDPKKDDRSGGREERAGPQTDFVGPWDGINQADCHCLGCLRETRPADSRGVVPFVAIVNARALCEIPAKCSSADAIWVYPLTLCGHIC